MRLFFAALLLLFTAACTEATDAPSDTAPADDPALVERARGIHERVLTLDTHDDIPYTFATPEVDPGVRDPNRQVDLPKMREGGLDVGFFIVYVGQTERTPENYATAKEGAMTKFNAIRRMTYEMYPDQIELAYTADDVERIYAEGKLVACIGIENGYVIGTDLSLIETYHELGARYMTLAHNGHNDISDSANPRPEFGDGATEHDGISAFGEEVIREMNRLGMMVDVSHISKQAAIEASRLSAAPVIASHSSTHALNEHARNMDDEAMRALAETGGVMNIVALAAFVKTDPVEKVAARNALRHEMGVVSRDAFRAMSDSTRAVYRERMADIDTQWPRPSVADFVDHIDYAVNLIGIDHVGISSDFDGGGGIVGWDDASETFNVTLELVRRGYSEEEIGKLWSGNLLRAWREVERVAADMQS